MMRKSPNQSEPTPAVELVRVENLCVHFAQRSGRLWQREIGTIRAVDGINFTLRQGETLALVGAAGCGKSTVARTLAMLERPVAGRVFFQNQELTALRGRHLKRMRRRIQIVFSDPYVAFAPRRTVEEIISEALDRHQRDQRLAELMTQVGLNLYLAVRYPRDLSGGNRQRVALARALAVEPSLLICDQLVDYVDPAMGQVIIDLLHRLNRQLGLTTLLTARRLDVARHADRVAIMIMGRIVEMGYYDDLIAQPLHPFTQALLQLSTGDGDSAVDIEFDQLYPVTGCHYAPVCPLAEAHCRASFPAFVEGAPNHGVACHLVEPS